MSTQQPEWKLIAQLGDENPVDHGGYFIYEDTTGVYDPEGEILLSPDDDDAPEGWTVYRFSLDRLKIVEEHTEAEPNVSRFYLVPFKYNENRDKWGTREWPHPISSYDEWFHKDLRGVASCCGYDLIELRQMFCSEDPRVRARAYQAVGDYHGFENLDSYPLHFKKRAEVEQRYEGKGGYKPE